MVQDGYNKIIICVVLYQSKNDIIIFIVISTIIRLLFIYGVLAIKK